MQDVRATMIIINGMVCWVGTSWAGWQERQDHAGCKIINWSRADGHEHTECAIETAANGAGLADSGQQAAIGELVNLRAARIQARALAVPLGGAAGSDGLTRLAVPGTRAGARQLFVHSREGAASAGDLPGGPAAPVPVCAAGTTRSPRTVRRCIAP
jgi:hypothetical protein